MPSTWALRIAVPALLAGMATPPQEPVRQEEILAKATFLSHLGNYIHWPEGAVQAPSPGGARPFTIGILGSTPIGRPLEGQVRDGQVNQRRVRLVTLHSLNPGLVRDCDILFISGSESDRLDQVLAACKGHPVLTLGDTPGYGGRGVMLNLTRQDQRLGLEANLEAIKAAGMEVYPSLLSLSRARTPVKP